MLCKSVTPPLHNKPPPGERESAWQPCPGAWLFKESVMFRCCNRGQVMGRALILAVCLLVPERAAAWSSGGHRVIANIAYDRLDPATRAKIVKVLRQHDDFQKRFTDLMPEAILK